MVKNTVIIGARADGHAKVVLRILELNPEIKVLGFIDDDLSKKGNLICGYPVLGSLNDLPDLIKKHSISGGMAAIGNNPQRRALNKSLESMGIELISAIHPSAVIDADVKLGKGLYIGQQVAIVTGSKIGNSVNIHTGATIDHDNVLEDGVNIGPGVHAAGRVHIGMDSFIGTGSSIIPDIKIEEGVIAGAGTVIIKNISKNKKVVGNPAREIHN